jgi:hypothetical protein
MQQQQGAIMKLAALGLATALAFTGTSAFAQSTGGSSTGGAAASGTTTGSPTGGTTTGNATGGIAGTGTTNSAGSAAAGQSSGLNPSGNSLSTRRPAVRRWRRRPAHPWADNKKPRTAGLFHRRWKSAISSLPAACDISRRRASPVGRALQACARWRRARRWRDPESAFSPPRSRPQPWPRRSVSR